MKNQIIKFNSDMMIELQNEFAYSDFALQLRHCMKSWTEEKVRCAKHALFGVLLFWSRRFDKYSEIYKQEESIFRFEIADTKAEIYELFSAFGFQYDSPYEVCTEECEEWVI